MGVGCQSHFRCRMYEVRHGRIENILFLRGLGGANLFRFYCLDLLLEEVGLGN